MNATNDEKFFCDVSFTRMVQEFHTFMSDFFRQPTIKITFKVTLRVWLRYLKVINFHEDEFQED